MGRNKGLPKQLTEKQELQHQQSINQVLRVIEELKAEELEKECELLRGKVFLLMQREARK